MRDNGRLEIPSALSSLSHFYTLPSFAIIWKDGHIGEDGDDDGNDKNDRPRNDGTLRRV